MQTSENCIIYDAYKDNMMNIETDKNWLHNFRNILKICDFLHVWNNQCTFSIKNTIFALSSKLESLYVSQWSHYVHNISEKLRTYALFKTDFVMENYILTCNFDTRCYLAKLRISAHKLNIELGRYHKPKKLEISQRLCKYCNSNAVEDEIHFVLDCNFYVKERKKLFDSLSTFCAINTLNRNELFKFLLTCNSGDLETCKLFSNFVKICFVKRNL